MKYSLAKNIFFLQFNEVKMHIYLVYYSVDLNNMRSFFLLRSTVESLVVNYSV